MNRGRHGEKIFETKEDYWSFIDLIRQLRNDTLTQAEEKFGIEKYSTVSSIVERVKYEMKADKSLEKRR